MKSTNKFLAIGRLGREVELRYTPGGDAVANFSLALSDDYKDKNGQKVEQTYWPRFSVFGKQAETLAQYVKKGDKLAVTAKFTTRKYTKDGQEREVTEFKVEDFELLSSKRQDSGEHYEDAPPRRAAPAAPLDEESIPF